MKKEMSFRSILEAAISEINAACRKASMIHSAGDIRDSGDEIEELLRKKIELFLPERYMVKKGHLVDYEGTVSNQLDVIIFDKYNTPKLFESNDNTVYYPIESVLAIGEIKKTLYNNDIVAFADKIEYIKTKMKRVLVENTIYGDHITPNASFDHMLHMDRTRKYCNSLFSFILSVDVNNFDELVFPTECKYIPNDIYILNKGALICGEVTSDKKIKYYIEDEYPEFESIIQIDCADYICFGNLLNNLLIHLNNSYISPYAISNYMKKDGDFSVTGSSIQMYRIRT